MQYSVASAFAVLGALSWYSPGFNGLWAAPAKVTPGEGQIVAAIFFVGAALLVFVPTKWTD